MFDVRQTQEFSDWLENLKDRHAVRRIAQRIVRLQSGLFGDVQPVGESVSELRINEGPGYRVYFIQKTGTLIILLCGGDKSTQAKDIKTAKQLASELEM